MSWLVWTALGVLLGPTALVLVPMILGLVGGDELRDKMGGLFAKQTMHLLGSGALVARDQGGLTLTKTTDDPKFDADRVTIAGEDGHLSDDLNVKGYLFTKPFGLAIEKACYVSPLFAEFGKQASRARFEDRIGQQADGGLRLDFELPELPQMADLRDARRVLDGDAGIRSGIVAEDWTQKSQEKFTDRVSLGQTMLLIIAFATGTGMALLLLKYGPSGGGGIDATVPIMTGAVSLLAMPGGGGSSDSDSDQDDGWIDDDTPTRMYVALAAVSVLGLLLTSTAYLVDGPLAAVGFAGGAIGTAAVPAFAMVALKDSLPASGVLSKVCLACAQFTFQKSAIVRTREGNYEWQALRETADGYRVVLNDGREIDIDGSENGLERWSLGKVALIEEKDDRNMARWTVEESASDREGDERATVTVEPPAKEQSSSWLVSLANVQTATRGSAQSDIVRRGREKAFEEAGGTQQISTFVTMILATVLLVVGFLLGWGALAL